MDAIIEQMDRICDEIDAEVSLAPRESLVSITASDNLDFSSIDKFHYILYISIKICL